MSIISWKSPYKVCVRKHKDILCNKGGRAVVHSAFTSRVLDVIPGLHIT